MTNRFKQPGEVITYTAPAAIANGDVVVIGARIGVALVAIPAGRAGSVQVSGVFTLPKKDTDDIAQGAAVYWDAGNKRVTKTATSNTLAGYAFSAAGADAVVIDIKLNA